jgi:hypothetical protein
MANKRLNDRDRTALLSFARQQIAATTDTAEIDAAYNKAADAISAAVRKENPPADMKVLAKYDLAHPDACIYVSTGGSNYEQFSFRTDDKRVPLRPYAARGCGYGRRNAILLTGDAEKAFDAYRDLVEADKAARDGRASYFKALIYGTPSFNALAEVWPAAEAMRERIVGTGTALAVLSSEVIDRLKADPALVPA